MDKIPREIVAEILCRLPIRYVVLCRCVCKAWSAIISDPSFYMILVNHPSKINPTSTIVYTYTTINWVRLLTFRFRDVFNRLLWLIEDNVDDVHVLPIFNLKNLKNPNIHTDHVCYSDPVLIGLCHGLLCLVSIYTQSSEPQHFRFFMYTFNLITGVYQQLPHFEGWNANFKSYSGFGYDISSMKFKVVMVQFYRIKGTNQIKNQVMVHTLGSNVWRKIRDAAPNVLHNQRELMSSVFINGSLHWITSSDDHKLIIVAFNIECEEFKVIFAPEWIGHLDIGVNLSKQFKLGVLEGCLSLVDCSRPGLFDIWLFKNYDERKPWVKKFSLQKESLWPSCNRVCPIKLQKNGEISLLCDDQFLVSYDTETNTRSSTWMIKKLGNKNLGNVHVFPIFGTFN